MAHAVHEHRWAICWLNDYDPHTDTVSPWCHCGRVEVGVPVDRFVRTYAPNGLTAIEHEYMARMRSRVRGSGASD